MDLGSVDESYARDRQRLVEELRGLGVSDLAVLHAVATVPRHRFVPEAVRHRAYQNAALPIGYGQTISRPSVHALHLALSELTGDERVLEIGTGSGYQTALLARLAGSVFSVERVPELSARALDVLDELGVGNVKLSVADGSHGWQEEAPFDVILIGAALPARPAHLYAQLAPRGRLLAPVGSGDAQELVRAWNRDGELEEETIDRARFVPLIGDHGW